MPYAPNGNPVDRIYPNIVAFAANSSVPFALDTNALVEDLQFQLTGTLTNAAYTTPPVKRVEGIENLIATLRVSGTAKAQGGRTADFCNVDAAYLAYKTRIMETTAPSRTDAGTSNAAYAFVSTFKKYFGAKGLAGFYPYTFLESRLLSTLTASFQFRDITALIDPTTGIGGTSALSNVQLTIHSREWQDGSIVTSAPYVRESQRSFDLTNYAGVDKDFLNMPVSNIVSRQTFKGLVGDVNYADPSDAIFATSQKVEGPHIKTVVNGNYTPKDSTYPQIRASDKTLFSLESVPTGYATVEYSRTRSIKDALNLTAARTAKNVADIAFTAGSINTLQITDEEIVGVS